MYRDSSNRKKHDVHKAGSSIWGAAAVRIRAADKADRNSQNQKEAADKEHKRTSLR